MAAGVVARRNRTLQGVWKTTPKICGKQGKISARWLFGSDRLGVFHRSRRGCALPRSPFDFAQGRLSTAVGMTGGARAR